MVDRRFKSAFVILYDIDTHVLVKGDKLKNSIDTLP